MTAGDDRSPKSPNLFYLGGVGWLLLSALAFWAYFNGTAPFDTLGIPISQLVLAAIFLWIGWRRAQRSRG
jgi:hypothetical protein